MVGINKKFSFIFILLSAAALAACGGGSSPAPENAELKIDPTPTTLPPVGDVTKVSDCGTLPGQWAFNDLTTGNPVSLTTYKTTEMQKAYRKSWGGTTTAYALIRQISGNIPVWNEGRTLHVGDGFSFKLTSMIRSIAITGSDKVVTILVGTDDNVVISDLNVVNGAFSLAKQVTVDSVVRVRSIDIASNQILEAGTAPIEMVYMVTDDAVVLSKLSDLRADFGCMHVAYQAKNHPVNPSDPKDNRRFRPIKVVAEDTLAAFLTASRLPEDFATAEQFKLALANEWTSFQSTAHLIDIVRAKPVVPFIMQFGKFDRFFASDIHMTATSVFLFGTRYQLAVPAVLESGIAIFNTPVGTPVANLWSGLPAKLGDFRMGRMDTFFSSALIRGLDGLARVDEFFSGPTQEKWSVWPSKFPFEYVRSLTYRATVGKKNEGIQEIVTVPQFLPAGVTTATWEHKDLKNNLGAPITINYPAITRILDGTPTDVSYYNSAPKAQDEYKNNIYSDHTIFQHTLDDGYATFPVTENDSGLSSAHTPRLFHTDGLIFHVRHGDGGARIRVFHESLTSKTTDLSVKGPAMIGFALKHSSTLVGSNFGDFDIKSIGAFKNMGPDLNLMRLDDIKVFKNPVLPNIINAAFLVHAWDGIANRYRVVIVQMDLSASSVKKRVAAIQGCSDIVDPGNNYSWNTAYGTLNDQARFLGNFTVTPNPKTGGVSVNGFFQHHNPVYNVWSLAMNVDAAMAPDGNECSSTGEITPLPKADIASGVSAATFGTGFVNLHPNGFLRWIESVTTTRILDVGANILGGPVNAPTGQVVQAGSHYLVRLDAVNGSHPTALLDLNGSFGENCSACQFTDLKSTGSIVFAAHPERGIEMYEFK